MLTMPSPTHHQLASWSGVFSWFCGRRTVFSSICFSGLSQFILLEGNRHVPNMSGLWPYLRIWWEPWSPGYAAVFSALHTSLGYPQGLETSTRWISSHWGFLFLSQQCQMGIDRSRDPKSCVQWFFSHSYRCTLQSSHPKSLLCTNLRKSSP